MRRPSRRWVAVAAVCVGLLLVTAPGAVAHVGHHRKPATYTKLYVPKPNHDAIVQIADLLSDGARWDAALIRRMIKTPQAVWVETGTPAEVRREVRATVKRAAAKKTVPVLVAYNLPFRDCAQYSAGGALDRAEYEAWIDGFAKGIGKYQAIVILEPDGLGIIPFNIDLNGNPEWCQPVDGNGDPQPGASPEDRYAALNYAVDSFGALPNVDVYLDGTHSSWLGVGDIADRLVKGGVERADGFFLNASNYQFTTNSIAYGNWVSACITYATDLVPGDFLGCPNQYWNGGPEGTMIAELLGPWTGVALSAYGEWSDDAPEPELNTSGLTQRYADMLGETEAATHFVIDTSRNGQGPWMPPADAPGDPQDWCNPPDRGLGARPTLKTGVELVAGFLWMKTPGESDGECYRWTEGPEDPVREMLDPAAGQWFPEMALELVHNANPPLKHRR